MKRALLASVILLAACRGSSSSSSTSSSETRSASETESGTFIAQRDVDAVDQPDGKRVVAHLERGKRYSLLKRGGPDRVWCKLDVGTGGWVLCSEGEGAAAPTATTTATATGTTKASGPFAYYVLTLSWSPAFCETSAGARSPEQCDGPRHFGFVVHGLWPQNEQGWPESCGQKPGPSPAVAKSMLEIMPSEHLIAHEWEKHGTCSGLSADAYFAHVRAAFQSIHIPPAYVAPKQAFDTDLEHVEKAFIEANPGLTGEAIAVECKRELDEVRICLDTDLHPRHCGSDVHDACKGTVRVPPVR